MAFFKRNKNKPEASSDDAVQAGAPDSAGVAGDDATAVFDAADADVTQVMDDLHDELDGAAADSADDTMPTYVGRHSAAGKSAQDTSSLGHAAAAWKAISSAVNSSASTAAGAGRQRLGAHSPRPAMDEPLDPDSTQAFLARTALLLDSVEFDDVDSDDGVFEDFSEPTQMLAAEPLEETGYATKVLGSDSASDADAGDFEKFMTPSHVAPKKKMKKGKVIGIILGAIVALLVVAYAAGAFYFSKHFTYGTTISDIDCSFMTVPEVEKLMADKADKYTMAVVGREDKKGEIKGSEIAFKYDADAGQVQKILDDQNTFLYPVSFIQKRFMDTEDESQSIEFTYDEDALKSAAESLEMFDKSKSRKPVDAFPEFDVKADKYIAHPEDNGTLVDKEKAIEVLSDKAKLAISEVDLDAEDCYVKPKVTTETPELVERIELLDKYVPFALTYEFPDGSTEQLNGEDVLDWLEIDDKGEWTGKFDEEALEEWVHEFAKKYDRVGTTRRFKSVDGNTYEVSGGTYGWSFDEAGEIEAIKNMLETKKSQTRTGEDFWVGESAEFVQGTAPDWGDTYIELNIATQHMFVIKDGEKVAEYDVVTGLPNGKRDTPTGVYYIMEKMSPKTLRGERIGKDKYEYETPVAYWLRVTGDGVGFHDASWQPSFGGNRYTYAGSHGCINMSYSNVQELYSLVETGTPVVIHYD